MKGLVNLDKVLPSFSLILNNVSRYFEDFFDFIVAFLYSILNKTFQSVSSDVYSAQLQLLRRRQSNYYFAEIKIQMQIATRFPIFIN